jgi:hypothetical protein
MKTVAEINSDILKISLKIQNDFPELSLFLSEMPITIPNEASPKVNIASLSEYYDSLKTILKKYIIKPKKVN